MADDTRLNVGSAGDLMATLDDSTRKHQKVIAEYSTGAPGAQMVDLTHGLPTSQAASPAPSATTMQNGATANGNGTSLTVAGFATTILNITASVAMSGGTTINFEGSVDDTTWVSLMALNIGTSTLATSTLTTGDWMVQVAGYKSVRARISAYSAGTITVKGYPIALSMPPMLTSFAVTNWPAALVPTVYDSAALEASKIVKASAGTLYYLSVYNGGDVDQWYALANATTVPGNGALVAMQPVKIAGRKTGGWNFGPLGKAFATGIVVYNSTTDPSATKTLGAADSLYSAGYA